MLNDCRRSSGVKGLIGKWWEPGTEHLWEALLPRQEKALEPTEVAILPHRHGAVCHGITHLKMVGLMLCEFYLLLFFKNKFPGAPGGAESVEHPTPDFYAGPDLGVWD